MSETRELITQAALKREDGEIVTLPSPARHSDLYLDPTFVFYEQGFLTSRGRFVDRSEAYSLAKDAGQIIERPDVTPTPGTLYTEDLW